MHFEEAIDHAADGDDAAADSSAKAGLGFVERVDANVTKSGQELATVLATRDRAIAVGAQAVYAAEFERADNELIASTRRIEDGEVAAARQRRPMLMKSYSKLELDSLERGTLEVAKAAVEAARETGAGDYAERTLREADQEIGLAKSILEADRTKVGEALEHTERATWLAGRATAITSVAKTFEEDGYDAEAIVLWHQRQLEFINAPLQTKLPFDTDNQMVVASARRTIESIVRSLQSARQTIRERQQTIESLRASLEDQRRESDRRISEILVKSGDEVEKLKSARGRDLAVQRDQSSSAMLALKTEYERKLSAEEDARRRVEAREERGRERMRRVHELFVESEAKILVEGGDVLVQAHGFMFKPGGAEISADNFGLLSRIAEAIGYFPGATVQVRGHTDSTGPTAQNRVLSALRATNVLEFLVKTKSIDRSRISATGDGSDRPIASNDAAAGRARNRRIEIRITPPPAISSL